MVSIVDIIQRLSWFPSLVSFVSFFFYGFRRGRNILFLKMVSVAGLLVDSAAAGGSIILECIERFLVLCVFRTGVRLWFVFMVSVVAGKRCVWFPWMVCLWCPAWQGTLLYGFRRWLLLWFPAATGMYLYIYIYIYICIYEISYDELGLVIFRIGAAGPDLTRLLAGGVGPVA